MIPISIEMSGLAETGTLQAAIMPGSTDPFGLLWSLASGSRLELPIAWIGLATMGLLRGPRDWF